MFRYNMTNAISIESNKTPLALYTLSFLRYTKKGIKFNIAPIAIKAPRNSS